MLTSDTPSRPAVTGLQARALLNATDTPRSASALNNGQTTGARTHLIDDLVRAGYLTRHARGRHLKYAITPAGREFSAYLQRLEAVREAL